MPAVTKNECQKCLGDKAVCRNNCQNPHYIRNRDFKCGCKPFEIRGFRNTHCCLCKNKSMCIKWIKIIIAQNANGKMELRIQ